MNTILQTLENGGLLVTATTRQAQHWRWQFDRAQAAAGKQGWPGPAILSLDAWLETLWNQSVLRGGSAGARQLLTDTQVQFLWRQLIDPDQVQAPATAARVATAAWRTMHDWQIPLQKVSAAATSADTRAFADWAQTYAGHCESHEYLDRATLIPALFADLHSKLLDLPDRVLFLGFEPWTPVLERWCSVLRDAGCQVQQVFPQATRVQPFRVDFAQEKPERETAVRWALASLRARPASVIGLVRPDMRECAPAMRRYALDVMDGSGCGFTGSDLPVVTGGDGSLADTGPVHAALLALRLCQGRMDYRDLGQLLRSPFLRDGEREADRRARFDLWIREHCQRNVDLWALQGAAREQAPGFGALLTAALDQVRARPRRMAAADWVVWCDRFLASLGWPGSAERTAEGQAQVEGWRRLLEDFSTCTAFLPRLPVAGVCSMLGALASDRQFRPRTAEHGLLLLTPVEAIGLRFDGLWVGGLDATQWPPAASANALLPMHLQREAGVPAAQPAVAAARAADLLSGLWQAADESVASWASECQQEQRVPASALSGLEPCGAERLELAPNAPKHDRVLWAAELEVIEQDPAPPLQPDERARGGSRLLKLQAACPARAFFELRLGAAELRIPAFGIDALARGRITHRALENLYEWIRARNLDIDDPAVLIRADEEVQMAIDELLDTRDPLLARLRVIETRRLLKLVHELLALDASRPPFRIAATERSRTVELGPLNLRIRPDRIDELHSDARLVFDYKTGASMSSSAWLNERLAEPQLPLYAISEAVDGIAAVLLSANGVRFVGVAARDTGIDGITPVDRFTRRRLDSWEALVTEWRQNLTALAEEFAAGSCGIDPDERGLATGQYAALTRAWDEQRGSLR